MGYRIVQMSRGLFTEMMTEGWSMPRRADERIRCVKGLPEGAKLEAVSMDYYFDSGHIALKFSHPSWADEPAGAVIPCFDVQYSVDTIEPGFFNFPPMDPEQEAAISAHLEKGVSCGDMIALPKRTEMITTLHLERGDVVVAHFKPETDLHRQAYCIEKLSESFPDNKVIGLIDDPRLTVIKSVDAPHIATG